MMDDKLGMIVKILFVSSACQWRAWCSFPTTDVIMGRHVGGNGSSGDSSNTALNEVQVLGE